MNETAKNEDELCKKLDKVNQRIETLQVDHNIKSDNYEEYDSRNAFGNTDREKIQTKEL